MFTGNVTVTVPLPATSADTTFKFHWTVLNWTCQGKDSATIRFDQHPGPVSAQKDTDLVNLDGDFTLKAVTPLIGTGNWYDSNGNIVPGGLVTGLKDTDNNQYEWLVVNGACRDSVYTKITAMVLRPVDAFSPNGDRWNQTFAIPGLDTSSVKITLTIFNSAGTRVYFTTNEHGTYVPWEGKNDKGIDVPDGTYYYTLTVRSLRNTTVHRFSRYVIVKRDV